VTGVSPDLGAIEELRFALAQGEAYDPPLELGKTLIAAALAERPPGRPHEEEPRISRVEALTRATSSLASLLESLTSDEWTQPALRGLDVQGLVGHLIGVEKDFQTSLNESSAVSMAEHVAATEPFALAQAGRPPEETFAEWRRAVTSTLDGFRTGSFGQDVLTRVCSLHGLRLEVGLILLVRSFELWTHEEDIRRATNRVLVAPDAGLLRVLTDMALDLVPLVMAVSAAGFENRSGRIVLIGPGGGTWDLRPTGTDKEDRQRRPTVRIVMEAVDFCRLVANRADSTKAIAIDGDQVFADEIFRAASSLALD
jgi:uncharacterized protein (TIGR03083 family)